MEPTVVGSAVFFTTAHVDASGSTSSGLAVGIDDLGRLAQNYGSASRGWLGGDFDYDGTTGIDDLGRLAQNYGAVESIAAPPASAVRSAPRRKPVSSQPQ